ncbi:uncharacterized protein Dwil_GK19347 [Drosophila willistoni]|uniref:Ionotropic glutamate receptor C-terminal domain-containing protein n=1 Tax=Drosophila willistoni TaxID=7260 RepID=B4MP66_DROWI|nr:uncharacterized protein Dwil_GK19347 [Drosophila willistoni]
MAFGYTAFIAEETNEPWTNTPIFRGHYVNNEDLSLLIQWLHRDIEVTTFIFTTAQEVDERNLLVNQLNKNNLLTLLFCDSSEELIWHHFDTSLWHLRQSRLIVSLPAERSDAYGDLIRIFKKLWYLQFLNVLVVHRERIYSYTPYPVVNYYELHLRDQLFPPVARDLQGYIVSTPMKNDLPRTFYVKDEQTGQRLIRGFAYHVLMEFLRHHNATLHVSNAEEEISLTSGVDMTRIMKLIQQHKMEISLHPYPEIDWHVGDSSYPLLINRVCLMTPVRNEIPRYMYLLRPFQWSSWLILLGAVIYITFIMYGACPVNRPKNLSYCFLLSISQLLFISCPLRIYRPSLRYFSIALQLAILGFLVTNWYCNELSSFLTTLLVGEQMDSIEQLIEQRQKLLVRTYEFDTVLRHVKPHLIDQVSRLMVGVNDSELFSAVLSFNRSYAYPSAEDRWGFLSLQQQYVLKPIFRYSSACLGSTGIGYPMLKNSHLSEHLKFFIMRIQAVGLLQHWLVSDFNDALRAGYVRLFDNDLPFKALDMDTTRLAWFILIVGWLLSSLGFIAERYRR